MLKYVNKKNSELSLCDKKCLCELCEEQEYIKELLISKNYKDKLYSFITKGSYKYTEYFFKCMPDNLFKTLLDSCDFILAYNKKQEIMGYIAYEKTNSVGPELNFVYIHSIYVTNKVPKSFADKYLMYYLEKLNMGDIIVVPRHLICRPFISHSVEVTNSAETSFKLSGRFLMKEANIRCFNYFFLKKKDENFFKYYKGNLV